jgi:adenylosuccinate synthase
VEPIYQTLPGWSGSLGTCRSFGDLPRPAQEYVKTIEGLIGAPIRIVSVGADRTATIVR